MPILEYSERAPAVAKEVAAFPSTFGLRNFPGKTFMVSKGASYYSDNEGVMLYTYIKDGEKWEAFAKGTTHELRRELTSAPEEIK